MRQCQEKEIAAVGPALNRVFNKLSEMDKRSEDRAIKLHERIGPLAERVAADNAKIDTIGKVVEAALAKYTVGGENDSQHSPTRNTVTLATLRLELREWASVTVGKYRECCELSPHNPHGAMPARIVFSILCGVMEKPDKVILLRTTDTEVALSADAAKLLRRIKILNWGDNPNCHQKRVNVRPLFAQCLAAATYPYRKVALDFEHNTFPGTAAYKKEIERKYEIAASDTKAKRAGEDTRKQAASLYREADRKESDANALENERQKIQTVLDKATIRRSRARDAAKTPVPKDWLFAAARILSAECGVTSAECAPHSELRTLSPLPAPCQMRPEGAFKRR